MHFLAQQLRNSTLTPVSACLPKGSDSINPLKPIHVATRSCVLALLTLALLAGCDNYRENVTIDPWVSQTIVVPAAPHGNGDTAISTTTIAQGSGIAVAAGDLVHLRYVRTGTWDDKSEHVEPARDAWIWTGREPDADMDLWGNFGSPELRHALIGRAVGERFELRVPVKYEEITSPLYGIAGPNSPRHGSSEFFGQYDALQPVTLAGGEFAWNKPSRSEIEIVNTCPARFATRLGHMTQSGHVMNMSTTGYENERNGILRWGAIEAQCPAPDGKVRFMLGPIYWTEKPWVHGMLMAWQSTYTNKHPKSAYPEDYAFVTINGRTLPTLLK